MRKRNLSREKALEEYLIYRKRVRELLDIFQIARDIKEHKYEPQDLLGRGPERFSETVGGILIGWFASLMDPHGSALNAFDVWLVLFPKRKAKVTETWEQVKPHVQLIRDYRNKVVCHASKNLNDYVNARLSFQGSRDKIVAAMQAVSGLAAELMRDEATALPNLRTEVDPILKGLSPNLSGQEIGQLEDYFLGGGETANSDRSV